MVFSVFGNFTVILSMYCISDTLDGKQISETAKQFLRNWHANKETQKKRKEDIIRRGNFIQDFDGKYGVDVEKKENI